MAQRRSLTVGHLVFPALAVLALVLASTVCGGEANQPRRTGGGLGVIPAEGECLQTYYLQSSGGFETPDDAMEAAGEDVADLVRDQPDASTVNWYRIENGERREAWRTLRGADGDWAMTYREVSGICSPGESEPPIP